MYYFVTYLYQPIIEGLTPHVANFILEDIHPVVWLMSPESKKYDNNDDYERRLLFWEELPPEVVEDRNVKKYLPHGKDTMEIKQKGTWKDKNDDSFYT